MCNGSVFILMYSKSVSIIQITSVTSVGKNSILFNVKSELRVPVPDPLNCWLAGRKGSLGSSKKGGEMFLD